MLSWGFSVASGDKAVFFVAGPGMVPLSATAAIVQARLDGLAPQVPSSGGATTTAVVVASVGLAATACSTGPVTMGSVPADIKPPEILLPNTDTTADTSSEASTQAHLAHADGSPVLSMWVRDSTGKEYWSDPDLDGAITEAVQESLREEFARLADLKNMRIVVGGVPVMLHPDHVVAVAIRPYPANFTNTL